MGTYSRLKIKACRFLLVVDQVKLMNVIRINCGGTLATGEYL